MEQSVACQVLKGRESRGVPNDHLTKQTQSLVSAPYA